MSRRTTAFTGDVCTHSIRQWPVTDSHSSLPTANKEYLEAAGALLRFLMKRMVRPDGTFWAYLDPRTGRCGEEADKWSDQSGSFHAKLALFLLDYARTAGDPEVRRSALQLLNRAASAQETNGRFATPTTHKNTHLHPPSS